MARQTAPCLCRLRCLLGCLVSVATAGASSSRSGDRCGARAIEPALPAAKAEPSVPVTPIDDAGAAARPGVDRSSVFRLVLQANPMLWPLAICSIVTLGYVLERFAGACGANG